MLHLVRGLMHEDRRDIFGQTVKIRRFRQQLFGGNIILLHILLNKAGVYHYFTGRGSLRRYFVFSVIAAALLHTQAYRIGFIKLQHFIAGAGTAHFVRHAGFKR